MDSSVDDKKHRNAEKFDDYEIRTSDDQEKSDQFKYSFFTKQNVVLLIFGALVLFASIIVVIWALSRSIFIGEKDFNYYLTNSTSESMIFNDKSSVYVINPSDININAKLVFNTSEYSSYKEFNFKTFKGDVYYQEINGDNIEFKKFCIENVIESDKSKLFTVEKSQKAFGYCFSEDGIFYADSVSKNIEFLAFKGVKVDQELLKTKCGLDDRNYPNLGNIEISKDGNHLIYECLRDTLEYGSDKNIFGLHLNSNEKNEKSFVLPNDQKFLISKSFNQMIQYGKYMFIVRNFTNNKDQNDLSFKNSEIFNGIPLEAILSDDEKLLHLIVRNEMNFELVTIDFESLLNLSENNPKHVKLIVKPINLNC